MPFYSLTNLVLEKFYYITTQPGVVYSKTPKHHSKPVFSRLKSPDSEIWATKQRIKTLKQPKQVILTDYSFKNASHKIERTHYDFILQLLQKGFEVCVIQSNNQLKKITLADWDLGTEKFKAIFEDTVLLPQDTIGSKLQWMGVNPDQCKILDHYEIEKLIALSNEKELDYEVSFVINQWMNPQFRNDLLKGVNKENVKRIRLYEVLYPKRSKRLTLEDLQHLMDAFINVDSIAIHAGGGGYYSDLIKDYSSLKRLKKLQILDMMEVPLKNEFFPTFSTEFKTLEMKELTNSNLLFKVTEDIFNPNRTGFRGDYNVTDNDESSLDLLISDDGVGEIEFNVKHLRVISEFTKGSSNFLDLDFTKPDSLISFEIVNKSVNVNIDNVKIPRNVQKIYLTNVRSEKQLDFSIYPQLRELHIEGDLKKFPLLPFSLESLKIILEDEEIVEAPSFANYKNLKNLYFKNVDVSNVCKESNPALKKLIFILCNSDERLHLQPNLEEFITISSLETIPKSMNSFHSLRFLAIDDAMNDKLVRPIIYFEDEESEIKIVPATVLSTLPDQLQELHVHKVDGLTHFPDLKGHESLRTIYIHNCKNLKVMRQLPRLTESLIITNCNNLDIPRVYRRSEYPALSNYTSNYNIIYFKNERDETWLLEVKPKSIIPKISYTKTMVMDNNSPNSEPLKTYYAIYQNQKGELIKAPASRYRHAIKDKIQLIDDQIIIDSLENKETTSLEVDPIIFVKKIDKEDLADSQYLVDLSLTLTNMWQPLPQLTCNDKIIKFLKPKNAKIRYNNQYQCYEIKSSNDAEIPQDLQYIFENSAEAKYSKPSLSIFPEVVRLLDDFFAIEHKPSSSQFRSLQKNIRKIRHGVMDFDDVMDFCKNQLLEYCKDFKDESINNTERDNIFLNALMQQRGVCRHRAVIFTTLCQYIGIPARLITNDIHAYAEILDDIHWKQIDLGGGTGVIINTENKPIFSKEKVLPIEEKEDIDELEPYLAYFSPQNQQNDLIADYKTFIEEFHKNSLLRIKVADLDTSQALYQEIKKHHPKSFYIESAADFERYEAFLTDFIKTDGTLVVNWERFNPKEMGVYKSLFDPNRTLKDKKVSPALKLINITTDRTQGTKVFLTRTKEMPWPNNVKQPESVIKPKFIDEQELKEHKHYTVIDLYNDTTEWESALISKMAFVNNNLEPAPSKLIQAIKQGKTRIILKDPPLNDADFKAFISRIFIDKAILVDKTSIPIPENFEICYLNPSCELQKPNNLKEKVAMPQVGKEVIYLNTFTVDSLSERLVLNKNKFSTQPGSLGSSKNNRPKCIVQTTPLTASELRKFYDVVNEYKHEIDFINLSNSPPTAAFELKSIDYTALPKANIIETSDPSFVSQQCESKNTLHIPITQMTSSEDVLVGLEPKPKTLEYKQIFKEAAEALIAGKNVVLYGTLTADLYSSLESLFGTEPYLTLFDSIDPQMVKGRLTVITTPITFETPLVSVQKKQFRVNPEQLWDLYYKQLKSDFNLLNIDADFKKIKLFYELVKKIPLGRIGTPPDIGLNYECLKTFIKLIHEEKEADNPIKSIFLHDFSKNKEEYAYINIIAKILFGNGKNKPAYRKKKFEQYSNKNEYIWRRLNCLNAAALQKLFSIDTLNETSVTQQLDEWLKTNPNVIAPNPDPQSKIFKKIAKRLKTGNAVVLKGPPGTGKTFFAKEYAKKNGSKVFWGVEDIDQWLDYKPLAGEEAVIIFDEANQFLPGTWEKLLNHPKLTQKHKMIFTCNPEEYPGRSYHPFLRKIPTIYVKSWTDESLLKYVILPMCESDSLFNPTIHKPILDLLIKSYRLAIELLPKDTLSVRDLQQVVFRWLSELKLKQSPVNAAQIAVSDEWGMSFADINIQNDFKTRLNRIFDTKIEVKQTSIPVPSQFYLSPQRRELLSTISKDMLLAEQASKNPKTMELAKVGIVIEGPSGIGKSTLLRQLLESKGYTELSCDQLLEAKVSDLSSQFIHFTVTGDIEKDKDIFLKAFQCGCKVILDELNFDPSLETYLNHLLTGSLPDKKDDKAIHYPGFFLLSSQNSIDHDGTESVSLALMNRLHVFYAKEDGYEDLLDITKQALPALEKSKQEHLTKAYMHQSKVYPKEVNTRAFFQGLSKVKESSGSVLIQTKKIP